MKRFIYILFLILSPVLVFGAVVPVSVGFNKEGKPFIQRENKNFIACGVTYHMMEHINTWEADLKAMKELSLNTIRIDFGWQDIEKKDNVFDFTRLDKFISLAQSQGFVLVISLAPNSMKSWLPEWMISGPLAKESWHLMDQKSQVVPGGWWNIPSPGNDVYIKYYKRYQAALISHIRANSCILGYLLYNEPHFPGGKEDPWCDYNPNTIKKFQTWLAGNYNNNIKALNKAWQTSYQKFAEIVPINRIPEEWQELAVEERKQFNDWRRFSSRLWAGFMNSLIANAKQADPDHVVMVTEMPWWFWGEGPKAGVAPEIFEKADIIGIDIYPGPDPADQDVPAAAVNMLMTLFKNKKPVWLSEINEKAGDPKPEYLSYNIRSSFEQGATGALFFEWSDKNERMDGGAYGLMKDAAARNPEFSYFKAIVKELNKKKNEYLSSGLAEPDVQVVWSEDNMFQTYNDIDHAYLVRGAFSMLGKHNVSLKVIREEDLAAGNFSGSLPVLLPSMLLLKTGTYEKLVAYVRQGGSLFCDTRFGEWQEDASSVISEKGTPRNFPELGLKIVSGTKDTESQVIRIQKDFYGLSADDKDLQADGFKEVLAGSTGALVVGTWNSSSDPAMIALPKVNKGKVFYSGTRIIDGSLWNLDRRALDLHSRTLLGFLKWSGRNIQAAPVKEEKDPSIDKEPGPAAPDDEAPVINTEQYSFMRLSYNQDFISFPANYGSGTGYDLPGEEMPGFDVVFSCLKHDTDFILIGASDQNNTMECRGQKITVNSSKYIRVHILGCTHNKAEEAELVLKYRNPRKTVILPFYIEDWWGGCNKDKPEEHCAVSFSHHNEKEGARYPEVHLIHKTIDL
ncbi:MAG: beta-galactosidase, partial [bacterium]|nr:beta-galactosidase [bacterium]